MHFIPAATLRSWGISDPSRMSMHGYGGGRIPDELSAVTYVDDLPPVCVHATEKGVYFYAVGPVGWEMAGGALQRVRNPFSDRGYYFITSTAGTPTRPAHRGAPGCGENPATDFLCPLLHEQDLAPIGDMGHDFYGEDFRTQPTCTFSFGLAGRREGTAVRLRTALAVNSTSASSVEISADGSPLGPARTVRATPQYHSGSGMVASYVLAPDAVGERIAITYRFRPTGQVKDARLDYIELNYTRAIALGDGGELQFSARQADVRLDGAGADTHVWDVTDPADVAEVSAAFDGGSLEWTMPSDSMRRYAAWNEDAKLPCPERVGVVANQNLHQLPDVSPDMVIITVPQWVGEASRLARIRRGGSAPVESVVVSADEIYNEFSSGVPDVNALRRYLKMVYDRGLAAGHPLRYALLLGRPTFDNRGIATDRRDMAVTLPTWQTDEALAEERSYTSDDIFAMLDDGSGADFRNDRLAIAVGRIPARTTAELRSYIDKLESYTGTIPDGEWCNRVIVVADDGDSGAHAVQSENFCGRVVENGLTMLFDKVYIDAYDVTGGVSEEGRRRMYRYLDEGGVWWHYTGHGTQYQLTAEKLITPSDIGTLSPRHLPVLCAVTCSFLRWDGKEPSGGERLALSADGGVIAAISATRRTFIEENAVFNDAIGRFAFTPDASGALPAVGDILQRAKNHLTSTSPSAEGRFRYVLLGDPSMPMAVPALRIAVESVDGEEISSDSQPVLAARQKAVVGCVVTDASGNPVDDFEGYVHVTLYDADRSTTTNGRPVAGSEGRQVTFDEHGDRLCVERDTVIGGRFTVEIDMPSEISDNFRPATLNMAAVSPSSHASAVFRNLYINGTDNSTPGDTLAPVVESIWLNREDFRNGATVNPTPMLVARVSDNTAISLATSGIGNVMTIRIDGSRTLGDVSSYYTPEASATGCAGTIAYPLPQMPEGAHTLELKVCDTSGNATYASVNFYVSENAAPEIIRIYTDANPASTQARFYITHDRPDTPLNLDMEIYDMRGRRVWTARHTWRSGVAATPALTWNLCDTGGHRVERGIYIYRAVITDAQNRASRPVAGRLAVTSQ